MNPGSGVCPTKGATSLLLLSLLHFTRGEAELKGEVDGNVGCLFSDIVCTTNEFCFNDLVIGQCISASSTNQHVERLGPLDGPAMGLLEAEMSRVFGLGFSWPDTYTQCVFQTLLQKIRLRQPYSQQECGTLMPAQTLVPHVSTVDTDIMEEDLDDIDGEEDGDLQREDMVFVPDDFQPSLYTFDDQGLNYDKQDIAYNHLINVLDNFQQASYPYATDYTIVPDDEDFDNDNKLIFVPTDIELPEELSSDSLPANQLTEVNDLYEEPYISHENFHTLDKRETSLEEDDEHQPSLRSYQPGDIQYVIEPLDDNLNMDEQFYQPILYLDTDEDNMVPEQDDNVLDQEQLTPTHNQHNGRETLMEAIYPDTDDEMDNYDFEYLDDSHEGKEDNDILYYNPNNEPIPVESVFNRHERLDVKKPGPFFPNSQNNFYLDKIPFDNDEEETVEDDDLGQTEYEYPLSHEEPRQKKDFQQLFMYSEPVTGSDDYLYVNIKDRFTSLGQAKKLWEYVADHLEIPKEVFSNFKPEASRIVLKVNSNPRQLNATEMAKILESDQSLRDHAKNDLGLDIDSYEAGDEKSSVMSIYSGPSKLFLLMFLLTAGIAALLLAAAVLLLVRRRSLNKAKKLKDDIKVEKEEPVKEYKQLVRDWSRSSRASQGSDNNHTAPASGQSKDRTSPNKILSKAGQNSEGSRTSSTSSWQEEPGTNCMDISTGHMVLSYMEDHLKNKQRLEQEWVGLCAYEAEPNSTSVSFKVENKKKNRYPDKLPYDHNRVLLNALVNGSNSDYINASTVMDHDPRNPAYIITQGPMTNTVADFWQMVWEQGSVVIVMLSKLSENGYQLCHRYWPEEGSEQYHIFEVHLVSEHVWCEDYMVRSLYLKNNQTGETRTVTQFHFLSWPDGNTPSSTKAILEFRRKVNKSYRGRSCPMIVHCSDGVGRSGTYVLIDMVLNRMMKGSKEIDIAATLEHIRDQRAGMVQTRSQFEFCLMAVAEETHAILKALPQ